MLVVVHVSSRLVCFVWICSARRKYMLFFLLPEINQTDGLLLPHLAVTAHLVALAEALLLGGTQGVPEHDVITQGHMHAPRCLCLSWKTTSSNAKLLKWRMWQATQTKQDEEKKNKSRSASIYVFTKQTIDNRFRRKPDKNQFRFRVIPADINTNQMSLWKAWLHVPKISGTSQNRWYLKLSLQICPSPLSASFYSMSSQTLLSHISS